MRPALNRRARQRGTTLVEAMIAMTVVLIGLLGYSSLQIVTVRASHYSRRMTQASSLATDLEENIKRWSYNDTRLKPIKTVSSLTDSDIKAGWDLGRQATPSPAVQFDDTYLAANFQGLSTDVDGDGTRDFTRFWNVYAADLSGTGNPN